MIEFEKEDPMVELSYNNIENDIIKLAREIKESKQKYTSLYGIVRGGIFIAVRLSHILDIPLTTRLKKGCLIIDEISDTGKELSKDKYSNYDTATLYKRYNSKFEPIYYAVDVMFDNLILFPWEKKNV